MAKQSGVRVADRRAANRQPSRCKLPCRVLRLTEEGPWTATVRNISAEGIGLVANRPFGRGTLITVELPSGANGEGEPRLVKVTHSRPQVGNPRWWVLGGFFARRLGRDVLARICARAPAILRQAERRTTARHTTRLKAPCRLVRASEEGPWQVSIRNVSSKGIGLISNRAFRPGSVLTVELPLLANQHVRQAEPRLVRITHVRPQSSGKWWVLGGLFARPLTREEVDGLL
jgi:hypothetical protein